MRRRYVRPGTLTAEELVARVEAADLDGPARRRLLGSLGYTPLDYFRARYGLRRWGAVPPGYFWHD